MSFTQITSSLICCAFLALRALGDPFVVLCCYLKTSRAQFLPWLLRGCQTPGCPSSAKPGPLLLYARELQTLSEKSSPFSPIWRKTESEWLSEPPEGDLTSPVCKTEGKSEVLSPAAHYTGCLVGFTRKLIVVPEKKIAEVPLYLWLLLQLEI